MKLVINNFTETGLYTNSKLKNNEYNDATQGIATGSSKLRIRIYAR